MKISKEKLLAAIEYALVRQHYDRVHEVPPGVEPWYGTFGEGHEWVYVDAFLSAEKLVDDILAKLVEIGE